MAQPVLLSFGLTGERMKALRLICMKNRIRLQPCAPEDGGKTLAALTGMKKNPEESGAVLNGEMIVFCGFTSSLLDRFLADFKRNRLKPVDCKAVLTPSNVLWTAAQLYEELKKEHEAMHGSAVKAHLNAEKKLKEAGLALSDILLPRAGTDLTKFACIACDQYTSQPEYWDRADAIVGDAPSALKMILPEARLAETEARLPKIREAMEAALTDGTLVPAVHGFVLTERTIPAGKRIGLVAAVDLDQYDYTPGSRCLIRPTEETVASRLPARVAVREQAPLELPHTLMLMDDADRTVLEPLCAKKDQLRPLYDFELMQDGGHLRGWAVEDESALAPLAEALTQLKAACGTEKPLFAVGDGNHSLATAKNCWEKIKPTLTEAERENHPARFTLVEIENIHDPALTFEPIHRVLTHVDAAAMTEALKALCAEQTEGAPETVTLIRKGCDEALTLRVPEGKLAVQTLQRFLDAKLKEMPGAAIDYVHGDQAVRSLVKTDDDLGLLLPPMKKECFFGLLASLGVMPRKTFSLGEADEKRFYLEARKIVR